MANAPVDLGELAEKGEDGVGSPCGRGIGEAVEIGWAIVLQRRRRPLVEGGDRR
jgi:hypothetical protein